MSMDFEINLSQFSKSEKRSGILLQNLQKNKAKQMA
jgi:hypothetical protein